MADMICFFIVIIAATSLYEFNYSIYLLFWHRIILRNNSIIHTKYFEEQKHIYIDFDEAGVRHINTNGNAK